MMYQDSLEPGVIQFMLKRLQKSAKRSGYFLPPFFMHSFTIVHCQIYEHLIKEIILSSNFLDFLVWSMQSSDYLLALIILKIYIHHCCKE